MPTTGRPRPPPVRCCCCACCCGAVLLFVGDWQVRAACGIHGAACGEGTVVLLLSVGDAWYAPGGHGGGGGGGGIEW